MKQETSQIPITSIILDEDICPRKGIDHRRVGIFAENIRDGIKFDPIEVEPCPDKPGWYRLLDGAHRWSAYKSMGKDSVEVLIKELNGADPLLYAAKKAIGPKQLTEEEARDTARHAYAGNSGLNSADIGKVIGRSRRTMDLKGILLAFLIVFFFNHGFSQEIIKIATEEYPPHTSRILKNNGLICHIVKEAFALEGIIVQYNFYPGKRAFQMAQKGEIDGALPWVWRKEREKYFYYPSPIINVGSTNFFHLKETDFNWYYQYSNYEDLRGIPIGGVRGYNYGDAFQKAVNTGKIKVQWVTTIQQNFKKLLLGRIKLFISQEDVAYYELFKNFNPNEIKKITHTLVNIRKTENYHLILSKKGKRGEYFLKTFNRGLKRLKKSGRLDQFRKESMQGVYIIKKP